MTHRKHVHSNEVNPVANAIRDYLTQMVPNVEHNQPLTSDEESLWNVLYRFENCHDPGKPSYPTPRNWGTLAIYLGVMVPLSSIEMVDGGELDQIPPALAETGLAYLPNLEES